MSLFSPSSNRLVQLDDMSSSAAAASRSQGSDTPPTLTQQQHQSSPTSCVHYPITSSNTLYPSFDPSIIQFPALGSVGTGADFNNSNSEPASISSRGTTNNDTEDDSKFDKWLGDIIPYKFQG